MKHMYAYIFTFTLFLKIMYYLKIFRVSFNSYLKLLFALYCIQSLFSP